MSEFIDVKELKEKFPKVADYILADVKIYKNPDEKEKKDAIPSSY